MKKSMAIRIGGFAAALCASGALIGTAVSGTGAYFTDSHSGEVDASTGHIRVAMSPSDGKLSFQNLLPGDYKTATIDYQAQGTSNEDIWLVFPTDDGHGNNPSEAFTGYPNDGHGGGLGRYGHLQVSSTDGASFVSNNLSNRPTNDNTPNDTCSIDANGEGGSNQLATSTDPNDPGSYVKYCAPANAILLASNVAPGHNGTATIEFGFTKLLTGPQDAPLNKVGSFVVEATQVGIHPNDVNN